MEGVHPARDMRAFGCACCGTYFIDPMAIADIRGRPEEEGYLVCASVRAASDAGTRLEITQDDLSRLRDSASRWSSPFEGVDRLLLLLGSRLEGIFKSVRVEKEVDFPLLVAFGPREMNDLLVLAGRLGFIDEHKLVFTTDGLKRLDYLRSFQPDSRQAFVAMWFSPDLDPAWSEGFKPGVESSGYFRAVRVDRVEHNEKIDDRIVAEIRRSGLLVADFTGHRGGVYFEAGLAVGLGIPVIWTCRRDHIEQAHFDTRQYNHIVWETPAELRTRLADRIAATLLPRGWLAS